MAEMTLEKCLQVLQTAKSDNERFASLLLVTKLIKAENSDEASRRRIFETVGFKFLERLLKSTTVPDGCPENSFRAIAVAILACFCSDTDMAKDPQMISKLPFFSDIILLNPSETDSSGDVALVDDCYQCLEAIASSDEGKKGFTHHRTVTALCRAYIEQFHGHERALNLVMLLCQQGRTDMWTHNTHGLTSLLNHLGYQFKHIQEETKFDFCKCLVTVLMSAYRVQLEATSSEWKEDIYNTLFQLLRSKLAGTYREWVLKLGCAFLDGCGLDCALQGRDKKFLLLVVHLVCIEVRMALEHHSLDEILSKAELVCHGYNLLENVISFLTTCPSLGLEEKQVQQLHSAMVGAFNAVIFFLSVIAEEHPEMSCTPLVCASVRALGSWLAEETSALQDAVHKILPFILQVCKQTYERQTGKSVSAEPRVDVPMLTDESVSCDPETATTEVLQFLLPGLCHLSSDDVPRAIVLQHQGHRLLGSYFSYHWEMFRDYKTAESEVAMITLCGIFMNLAVMEPSLVAGDQVFRELLDFIMATLPTLDVSEERAVLLMNLCVLGLMLLHQQISVLTSSEGECRKFCVAVISLLSRAHTVQTRKKSKKQLIVTDIYKQEWASCIKELWLLGMQAFSENVILLSWLPGTVLHTGWLPAAVKMLLEVKVETVDAETRIAYQTLFHEMAEHSTQAKHVLIEKEARKLARLYKMENLVKILA